MQVIVGSTSSIKIRAVQAAFQRMHVPAVVAGVPTPQRANAQPMGFTETDTGALARVLDAKYAALAEGRPFDVVIGIENGILVEDSRGAFDFAMVHVLVYASNKTYKGMSASVYFPWPDVTKAMQRGLSKVTVGAVIAERTGSNPQDPHAFLTGGHLDREEILIQAIISVVSQALRG